MVASQLSLYGKVVASADTIKVKQMYEGYMVSFTRSIHKYNCLSYQIGETIFDFLSRYFTVYARIEYLCAATQSSQRYNKRMPPQTVGLGSTSFLTQQKRFKLSLTLILLILLLLYG